MRVTYTEEKVRVRLRSLDVGDALLEGLSGIARGKDETKSFRLELDLTSEGVRVYRENEGIKVLINPNEYSKLMNGRSLDYDNAFIYVTD